MKKNISFFSFLILTVQISFAQKLFFSRENYSDSILFEKNIVNLARQAVVLYKEPDQEKYYDNLFRLQIVAEQYDAVEPTLIKCADLYFGDTVTTRFLAFGYRMYSATMAKNPDKNSFANIYRQTFTEAYNALENEGKNWVPQYFSNSVEGMLSTLNKTKTATSHDDSISINQAVALCKSYCAVKCYSTTLPLAKALLQSFEDDMYIKQDSVLIKMPDGGTISLTIVRDKKITTPQPVVLMYNIYSQKDMTPSCKNSVSRGYVGIVADTRGKRLSPDSIEPFEHDAKDAYHIIDWISKQPWCNGKVGMYGGSYLGFSQWSATKYLHPALKTIVPQAPVAPGIDFPMENGIFMHYMLRWIKKVTTGKLDNYAVFSDNDKWLNLSTQWYNEGKSYRSLDTLEGGHDKIYQRWLQHPSYDSHWQKMIPQKEEFAKINIPIFTTTGYWDSDQLGTMYYYQQYQQYNKSNNIYLLIGPYDHGGAQDYPKPKVGGYTIDSVANVPIIDIVFEWFNHTLKDSSLPAILKDKVNFQMMGTNEWKHVPALNKMSNDTLRLFLGNSSVDKRYPLLKSKSEKSDFIKQSIDLKNRKDTGSIREELSGAPTLVDSILHAPDHQMVFVSEAIEKPFAISGAASASITAAVNKRDMDVSFSLYELTPDGKYISLASTLQRASYAKDRKKRNLLTPGKAQIFEIKNTYITCKQLEKGSRIVVVFGIFKNPLWQINYGTGKDVSDETMGDAEIPIEVKWYNSSYINIPILK